MGTGGYASALRGRRPSEPRSASVGRSRAMLKAAPRDHEDKRAAEPSEARDGSQERTASSPARLDNARRHYMRTDEELAREDGAELAEEVCGASAESGAGAPQELTKDPCGADTEFGEKLTRDSSNELQELDDEPEKRLRPS